MHYTAPDHTAVAVLPGAGPERRGWKDPPPCPRLSLNIASVNPQALIWFWWVSPSGTLCAPDLSVGRELGTKQLAPPSSPDSVPHSRVPLPQPVQVSTKSPSLRQRRTSGSSSRDTSHSAAVFLVDAWPPSLIGARKHRSQDRPLLPLPKPAATALLTSLIAFPKQ